jgi:DNA-binding response OmpR family regulator
MSENIEKTRILVVDDSRTVRAAINKVLCSHFEVIQAGDGEEAWQQIDSTPGIRMVISDIMMPNLDGYGLICRIRAAEDEAVNRLPIVVITSSDDEITRERAHACGANDFIVKPVEFSDLVERANFHTEARLGSNGAAAGSVHDFAEVEMAVVETPDINTALEIISGAREGSITPYAIDLCIEILPLLEYCEQTFSLSIAAEIEKIKKQLKQQEI